jgi:hypothetical protein
MKEKNKQTNKQKEKTGETNKPFKQSFSGVCDHLLQNTFHVLRKEKKKIDFVDRN